jgi:hypothetical protein
MDYNIIEDGRISIPYRRERGNLSFTDAIILSQEEYDIMTEEHISAIMDERFERWYQLVTRVDD